MSILIEFFLEKFLLIFVLPLTRLLLISRVYKTTAARFTTAGEGACSSRKMQSQNIVGRGLAAAESKGVKPKETAGASPRPTTLIRI